MRETGRRIYSILSALTESTRIFKMGLFFSTPSLTFFPFFALLIEEGLITSLWALTIFLPYIVAGALGFLYNNVCDREIDPKEKNPITSGQLSVKLAIRAILFLILVSLVLSFMIFRNTLAQISYLALIVLMLAYCGLKVRLKESYLTPFVATYVLWMGGPLSLVLEYSFFNFEVVLLWVASFSVFAAQEINHEVRDFETDQQLGCRTFAVRLGKRVSILADYGLTIIGYSLFLALAYLFLSYPVFIMLTAIPTLHFILWHFKKKSDKDYFSPMLPFKLMLVVYGGISITSISPMLLLALFVWLYVSTPW